MTEHPVGNQEMTRTEVAVKRGKQTAWQGLVAVALVTIGTSIGMAVAGAGSWVDFFGQWQVWTWAAAQALVTALVAWVSRKFVDDTGFGENHNNGE